MIWIRALRIAVAAIALAQVPTGDSRAFATVTYNRTAQASQWHIEEEGAAEACAAPSGIPAVFHRSHRFTFSDLESVVKRSVDDQGAPVPEALFRVRRNLDSCAEMNPDIQTRYYDDEQVLERGTLRRGLLTKNCVVVVSGRACFSARLKPLMGGGCDDVQVEGALDRLHAYLQQHEQPDIAATVGACIARLRTDAVLRDVFVLRSDFFRLAILFLDGGWWIDSDVVCIDPLHRTLDLVLAVEEQRHAGCTLAWEGAVTGVSSPLNWALGCKRRHPFLLQAMLHSSRNVLSWLRPDDGGTRPAQPEFCAQVGPPGGRVAVPVLLLTGPAALQQALENYSKALMHMSLDRLRKYHGERGEEPDTWGQISLIKGAGGGGAAAAASVLVLPYCFFRSRGCLHLRQRYGDRVIFHHEFDTGEERPLWLLWPIGNDTQQR